MENNPEKPRLGTENELLCVSFGQGLTQFRVKRGYKTDICCVFQDIGMNETLAYSSVWG